MIRCWKCDRFSSTRQTKNDVSILRKQLLHGPHRETGVVLCSLSVWFQYTLAKGKMCTGLTNLFCGIDSGIVTIVTDKNVENYHQIKFVTENGVTLDPSAHYYKGLPVTNSNDTGTAFSNSNNQSPKVVLSSGKYANVRFEDLVMRVDSTHIFAECVFMNCIIQLSENMSFVNPIFYGCQITGDVNLTITAKSSFDASFKMVNCVVTAATMIGSVFGSGYACSGLFIGNNFKKISEKPSKISAKTGSFNNTQPWMNNP